MENMLKSRSLCEPSLASRAGFHKNYLDLKLQHCPVFWGTIHLSQLQFYKLGNIKYPFSLILLDKKHFTSLTIINKHACIYFDSLGSLNLHKNKKLLQFLHLNKLHQVFYNKKVIQQSKSDRCGLFAMAFVEKQIINLRLFQTFLNLFSNKNKSKNDHIVKLLLHQHDIVTYK